MKNKKEFIIIGVLLFVVIGLIVYILLDNNYKKEVKLNESFELPLGKGVIVKDENLKIKLISVDDSRCKEGLQCIWEGEISYTIKINDKEEKLGTKLMKSVDYKEYRILLDEENDSLKYVKLKIDKWR